MHELKHTSEPLPIRIGMIGTGLIGTSFLLALKARGHAFSIAAFDSDRACLEKADALVSFDICASSIEQVIAHSDVVVIATFPRAIADVLAHCSELSENALITDVASVKRNVHKAAQGVLGENCGQFVPAHPLAGSACSGPQAASAELFESCRVIITPMEQNSPQAVQTVVNLWHGVGATHVFQMTAEQHDHVFAYSSHLPHALAYALVHSLTETMSDADILQYSAGGLRDFTRIAASDPELWCDILLSNSDQVISALRDFNASYSQLHTMLRESDRKGLRDFFQSVARLQSQINKRSQ